MQPNSPAIRPADYAPDAATEPLPEGVEVKPFLSYFREQNTWMYGEQRSLWIPIYDNAIKAAAYAMGRQALLKNPGGIGYRRYKFKGKEQDLHTYNLFTPYVDEMVSQWVNINPKVDAALLTDDDRRAKKAKDEYDALTTHYFHELLSEHDKIRLALNGLLGGQYLAEIFFDPNGNGEEQFTPVETLQLPGLATAQCLDCGAEFEPDGTGRCVDPYCRSANLLEDAQEGSEIELPGEPQRRKAGKVGARVHDMWACRYSLTVGKEKSDWFYVEEEVLRSSVQALYGKLNNEVGESRYTDDETLHCARVFRRLDRTHQPDSFSAGFGSGSGSDDHENVTLQRFFYSPERLKFIALEADFETRTEWGEKWVIPANKPLDQVFPAGMVICTAQGVDRFFYVDKADHKRRFKVGFYAQLLGKHHGRGTEDARVNQFQINKLRSAQYSHFARTLQPSIVVDRKAFGNDTKLFNRESGIIEANSSALDGRSVKDFFAPVQSATIDQTVFLFDQLLQTGIKQSVKAYDSTTDVTGTENPTARAASLGQARRQEAPSLHYAQYAGWWKDVILEVFDLVKEHHQDLLIISTSEKLNQSRKQTYFDTNLLREGVLIAWVRANSFLPNLELEKRGKFLEATAAAQGLAALQLLNEKTLNQIHELFGVDFTGEATESNENCEEALDLMQAYHDEQQGIVLPEELYSLKPVDPYELGHEDALMWWRKLLTSSVGQKLQPILRDAIHLHIDFRKQAIAQVAIEAQMTMAAPQMAMQAMMPQPEEGQPVKGKQSNGESKNSSGGQRQGHQPAAAPAF